MEEGLVEERKEKVLKFLKRKETIIIGLLVVALILGIYIRSLPMQTRADTGNPGLWDVVRDDWTLGPDLDPWLFTRYAKTIVEEGGLPEIDKMRYSPVGYDPSRETRLLPYMIAGTYWIVNLFGNFSVEFAAALFPVIMFALTILSFFFFVREIFNGKTEKQKIRANVISIIATFFMIVIPIFLSRTIAGIPEKESAGFFFMFLAFYFFLKAWRSEKMKNSLMLGSLAGISTALMGLIWGGVIYIFVSIALASLVAFILNKVKKKEFLIYSLWFVFSWGLMLLFSNRLSLKTLATSVNTGFALLVLLILGFHFILWKTKLSELGIVKKSKLPKNIVSLIFAIVLGLILVVLFFGPGFIFEKISSINQILFKPVTGRWAVTVAENKQPYFIEWAGSFGPFLSNIPVLFWMFFLGSIVLFKKMLNKIKQKDSWILTGLYILFFFGLVFSRYSSTSVFNGANFISSFFYYGSALLLFGSMIYYYLKYSKEENKGFEKISFNYIFLFALFILTLFTARSAVRLIMVLAPVVPIFASYLVVDSFERFRNSKDETWKIVLGIFVVLLIVFSLFAFQSFYKSVRAQGKGMIPSPYNNQWQKAMGWVRDNTPQDSVFGHWWDYGYWVQSIGERATVLDGSNSIVYWNYLMGRLVLTGDDQSKALDFLYAHDTNYLLIDSSDIGKYGAFSSIGSDENNDRFSWVPVIVSDPKQMQETSDGIRKVYQAGTIIDEDIIYELDGNKIFLPRNQAALAGVILDYSPDNVTVSFKQPQAVYVYNGQQYRIPIRYVYFNGELFDFKSGIEALFDIIPYIDGNFKVDPVGAGIYLTPRLLRGMLAQKYLLNDVFGNFDRFELVHSEPDVIIDSFNQQGAGLGEFVYFQGLRGPIKIWEIKYTGSETKKEEYLDTDYTKYLDWKL